MCPRVPKDSHSRSIPQQTTAGSVRMPQVCKCPALTALNVPDGGADCSHSNHNLASCMPLGEIADGRGYLAQRIGSIDHRLELSGFCQLLQDGQVFWRD